jgi:hypothetical protein
VKQDARAEKHGSKKQKMATQMAMRIAKIAGTVAPVKSEGCIAAICRVFDIIQKIGNNAVSRDLFFRVFPWIRQLLDFVS